MSRRQFSDEYKQEAVRLVLEQGLTVKQAASDLGIGQSTLDKWLSNYRKSHNGEEQITQSQLAELKRLRRENSVLRMERDILKKATALFAKTTT